jgi:hypothetical protein
MGFSFANTLAYERLRAVFHRPHDAPTFIFGNQKAGTTAIAGLLAAATGETLIADFRGAREPYLGPLLRGDTSIADFVARNAWAFSAPIVKEPSLSFVAPALLNYFPVSRAVFIVRDPWANIRSILGRLTMRGDANAPVREDGRRLNPTWQSILAGRDLGFAPDHYIDTLAKRWVRAAQICETLGERVAVLRYEDFNRSKQQTIAGLIGALNLTARNDISNILNYPFQRSGQSDGSMAEFFGPNLARIDAICAETAARFGYQPPSRSAKSLAAE